jgi:hypothetical protein
VTPRSWGPAISTRELVMVRRGRVRFFRVLDVQRELQRGEDQEVRSRGGSWRVLRRVGSIPWGARGWTRVAALRWLRLDLNIRFGWSGPRCWMRRQIVRRLFTPLVLACLMGSPRSQVSGRAQIRNGKRNISSMCHHDNDTASAGPASLLWWVKFRHLHRPIPLIYNGPG